MARTKRRATVFSLSFLDIMSCGFGAVVLFFMIINHATKETNAQVNIELVSEVSLMDKRIELARKNMFELRNTIEIIDEDNVRVSGQIQQVILVLDEKREELANMDGTTLAQREAIEKLKTDIRSIEEAMRRLEGSQNQDSDTGDDLRSIMGTGDRLYLTGLKLGGQRVLFLVDSSASMLDETIVNVIRRRNMSDADKRQSHKWRRALGSVNWLMAKLPTGTDFQIYTFNQTAQSVLPAADGKWLNTGNKSNVDEAIAALNQIIPEKGTSLYRAFEISKKLNPPPDNIYLLTDGLPTMADKLPIRKTASPRLRVKHFNSALNILTAGIPVNTILFPMEGDANAAPSYWRLAMVTNGSFIAPARDWP